MLIGKYKKRLYKTFIIISIILVLVLMITIGVSFSINQKNQYISTQQQAISTQANMAQLSMMVINNALNDIVQNPAFEEWSNAKTNAEYYHASTKAYNQLQKITTNLSPIDYEIAATKLDETSFVISLYGTISKKMFFDTETTLNPQQISYMFDYFQKNTGSLILPTYSENQLKEIYYILKRKYAQSDMVYIVKIPYHTLFGSTNNQHFILFNSNQILAYSSIDPKQKKIANDVYYANPNLQNADYYFKMQNKIIFLSKLEDIDWSIAYIYENTGFQALQFLIYIVLPSIFLLLLTLLISKMIIERLYKPVKEVISDIVPENTKDPIIDEFQLLKQNTNQIKILSQQLQAAIAEKNVLLSQHFYRDLLYGTNINSTVYDQFRIKPKNYCVALIEFQSNIDEISDNEIFLYKNHIYSSTQEYDHLQYINISYNTCALIIQTDRLSDAKECIFFLTQDLDENMELKISISDIKLGIDKIHECFKEALKILEYKYLYGKSEILTMQQVADLVATTYYYPLLTESRLIQSMLEGKNSAIDIFNELIRENIQYRNLAPDTLKNFIFALIGTLNRVFQELKITPEELLDRDIDFDNLYNSWNDVSIVAKLKEIIQGILKGVTAKNKNMDDELLSDMLQYIYDNYSDDIMLNDMADQFNISPKYCSALFKKLSGDTFKNVLNKHRIDKAKEFIEKNPEIKVTDLSTMVGFNSSNSFIRVFSKYTGVTPKAFADKLKEERDLT